MIEEGQLRSFETAGGGTADMIVKYVGVGAVGETVKYVGERAAEGQVEYVDGGEAHGTVEYVGGGAAEKVDSEQQDQVLTLEMHELLIEAGIPWGKSYVDMDREIMEPSDYDEGEYLDCGEIMLSEVNNEKSCKARI